MCTGLRSLISLSIAASVVVLPLPVAPVTSTRPVFSFAISLKMPGRSKCFQGGNGRFELAQNDRKISALPENINAKTRLIAQRITEIAGAAAQIIVHQPPIALHQGECDLFGLIRSEDVDRRIDKDRL